MKTALTAAALCAFLTSTAAANDLLQQVGEQMAQQPEVVFQIGAAFYGCPKGTVTYEQYRESFVYYVKSLGTGETAETLDFVEKDARSMAPFQNGMSCTTARYAAQAQARM